MSKASEIWAALRRRLHPQWMLEMWRGPRKVSEQDKKRKDKGEPQEETVADGLRKKRIPVSLPKVGWKDREDPKE